MVLAQSDQSPAALLSQCVERCVEGLTLPEKMGFYAVHEARTFGPTFGSGTIRDYGPMEFLANFHSLWMYAVANRLKRPGPVTTFSDAENGVAQALTCARHDLEEGDVEGVIISYMGAEGAVSLFASSPDWLVL